MDDSAVVAQLKIFLKDDSLTDDELLLSVEDAKNIIEEEYSSHSNYAYLLRLYAAYLLEKMGKIATMQTLSHNGLSAQFGSRVSHTGYVFLDLFNYHVNNGLPFIV